MSNRAVILFVSLGLVLDRITKEIVLAQMTLGESIPVVPGFFSLVSVRNRGGAFGLLADLPPAVGLAFFVIVASATVAVLAWMLSRVAAEERWQRFALASVISGAVGNLYDRIRFGEVVDFLDCYWGAWHWPAFNVADSLITVGVVLLLLSSFAPETEEGTDS